MMAPQMKWLREVKMLEEYSKEMPEVQSETSPLKSDLEGHAKPRSRQVAEGVSKGWKSNFHLVGEKCRFTLTPFFAPLRLWVRLYVGIQESSLPCE